MSAVISTKTCTILTVRSNFTGLICLSQYLVYMYFPEKVFLSVMHNQNSSI